MDGSRQKEERFLATLGMAVMGAFIPPCGATLCSYVGRIDDFECQGSDGAPGEIGH